MLHYIRKIIFRRIKFVGRQLNIRVILYSILLCAHGLDVETGGKKILIRIENSVSKFHCAAIRVQHVEAICN